MKNQPNQNNDQWFFEGNIDPDSHSQIKDPVRNLGNPLQPNVIGNPPLFSCPYRALKISPGVS